MVTIDLPYGAGILPLSLPEAWLGEVVLPQPVTPPAGGAELVKAALAQPIGCPPLAGLVKRGQAIAIMLDDHTRKTPVRLLLPAVLEEVYRAGVAPADIRLVAALGTHRPMTEAEIEAKVGTDLAAQYRPVNSPSTDDGEMVYLGTASNGIPAWVNRAVAEADVRIGLGSITPHLDAGFSGGAKIILPGVCSARTVDAFHTASAFIPENQLGRVDAPLRRHLEQFVAERVPLDFMVNTISTLAGDMYQCVAGHPIEAHRAGVSYARAVFGTPVVRRYPVVVANAYPYDLDLWQSIKGAWSGELLTATGGTLILVTAAPEGNSTYPLVPGYSGRDPDELRGEIEAGAVADAKQAATGVMFGQLKRRINLALVSTGLTQADAAAMGVGYYHTVEAAVTAAAGRLPEAARPGAVGVMPQAGLTLPLLPDREVHHA